MYNEKNMTIYEMYLESNKARNFETINTTYKMYKSRMINFLAFLKNEEGNKLLLSENTLKNCVTILERYINHCREAGNNNQTINNKLTAISSFYIWCVKRDLIKYHPFQHKLDRLKRGAFDKRRESYFLSVEDIIKARVLMEHNEKRFDLQSRLLWELFLESAARISAISELKLSQLDLKNGYFKNVKEKGNKIIDLIFLDNTEKILVEWLSYRKEKNIESEYLFITKQNGVFVKMQQSTIRARIKAIGKLIGYDDIYPHTLRKTAINLLNNLTDINFAAEYAHHNDTQTTKKHYIKSKTAIENRNKLLQIRKERGF
jgi:integrase/recombinase XerC